MTRSFLFAAFISATIGLMLGLVITVNFLTPEGLPCRERPCPGWSSPESCAGMVCPCSQPACEARSDFGACIYPYNAPPEGYEVPTP